MKKYFYFLLAVFTIFCACSSSTNRNEDMDAGGDVDSDTDADTDVDSDSDSDSDSDTGEMTECADGNGMFDPNTKLCWQDVMPPKEGYDWIEISGGNSGYCDKLSFGGHPDWRIPTIDELRSLIRGCPATETGGKCPLTADGGVDSYNESCDGCAKLKGPGVGGRYCDPALNGYSDQRYWDLTWSLSGHGDRMWFINLSRGELTMDPISDDGSDEEGDYFYKYNIRCVRSDTDTDTGPPEPAPDCDGGKLDESTGLCWQHPVVMSGDWQGAIDYCDGLDLEGHTDWYLPSKQEIIDLLEGGCDEGVLKGTGGWCNSCRESESCAAMFGPDFPSFSSLWTSSSEDGFKAWNCNLGGKAFGKFSKDTIATVRCVRVE
jgi:uncharacterized protein DUF1566